jgi:hypothetical protein
MISVREFNMMTALKVFRAINKYLMEQAINTGLCRFSIEYDNKMYRATLYTKENEFTGIGNVPSIAIEKLFHAAEIKW